MKMPPNRSPRPSIYSKYWALYGGWGAILSSKYLLYALLLTDVSYTVWGKEGWWDVSVSILPSILGFSLAAFTMLLAFGSDRFLVVLATRPKGGGISALEGTSAAFFHFLFMQIVALLLALLAKTLPGLVVDLLFVGSYLHFNEVFLDAALYLIVRSVSAIGFLLLCYSILCALAASARIFNLSLRFRDVVELEEVKRLAEEDKLLEAERNAPEVP